MSEENKLVKREVPFVTEALQTLEGARKWAAGYLEDGVGAPHFYKKMPDGKPDYSKPKIGALLAVVTHGNDVGMSVSQAIQQIVPINNLTCIKGDGAKALIMASGLCAEWKEGQSP